MAAEQVGHRHGRITVHYQKCPSTYKELRFETCWFLYDTENTLLRALNHEVINLDSEHTGEDDLCKISKLLNIPVVERTFTQKVDGPLECHVR